MQMRNATTQLSRVTRTLVSPSPIAILSMDVYPSSSDLYVLQYLSCMRLFTFVHPLCKIPYSLMFVPLAIHHEELQCHNYRLVYASQFRCRIRGMTSILKYLKDVYFRLFSVVLAPPSPCFSLIGRSTLTELAV